jgi:hypothetical protein
MKGAKILLGFLAICCAAARGADWSPSQTENSVVQIALIMPGDPNGTTLGTGFFVRTDGVIVT